MYLAEENSNKSTERNGFTCKVVVEAGPVTPVGPGSPYRREKLIQNVIL